MKHRISLSASLSQNNMKHFLNTLTLRCFTFKHLVKYRRKKWNSTTIGI